MKLRVLAFALAILAFFIFVGSPFGESAKAIAIVDDAAFIALLVAALSAVGATFWTNGAYGNVADAVKGLFTEFCSYKSISYESAIRNVNYGRNNVGQVILNNSMIALLDEFAVWAIGELGLTSNNRVNYISGAYKITDDLGNIYNVSTESNPTAGTSLHFIDKTTASTSTYNFGDGEITLSIESYVGGAYRVVITNNITGNVDSQYSGINNNQNYGNIYLVWLPQDGNNPAGVYLYLVYANDLNGWRPTTNIRRFWYLEGYLKDADVDIITGALNPPSDDSDYQPGDGAILDVGASWGTSLGDITGKVIPGDFSASNVGSATLTYDGSETLEQEVIDAGTTEISSEAESYQSPGLQNVFPFCIPFDLYNFVACLAADPVAPSFTWRFYVPGICDESIEIDLSEFDAAAQILRTMELLLFCVGLAFVTRKIIRG